MGTRLPLQNFALQGCYKFIENYIKLAVRNHKEVRMYMCEMPDLPKGDPAIVVDKARKAYDSGEHLKPTGIAPHWRSDHEDRLPPPQREGPKLQPKGS